MVYVGSARIAVLLCRLFVTCAGVPAGIISKGVCSTAVYLLMILKLYPYLVPENPQKLTLKLLRIDYRTQHLLDNDYRTHNVHCLLRSTAYMSYYACVVHLMLCDECTLQLLLGNYCV